MELQLSNRTKTPVLAMLMLLLWLAVPARAQVAINETNFPDANFRAWVQANYEASNPGYLDEAAAAQLKSLSKDNVPNGDNVTNLKGIEYFTGLTRIDWCMGNLTELDVTNNTELTYLDCNSNQLTELDVTNNTELAHLNCSNNQLTSLDVTKNTALTELKCAGNQLTELDVNNNTDLIKLECDNNQLTELDVTNNAALFYLKCQYNQLTELDVTKNTKLTTLNCSVNQLTELDVNNNTALINLSCNNNQLTELNVTNNTALKTLYCRDNQITTLDLSQNPLIAMLSCRMNKLTSLDLSNLSTLVSADISNQKVAIGPVIKYIDGDNDYYYVSLEESIEGQPSFIDMVHILEGTTSETFVPFDLSRVSWTSGCEVFHGTKQGAPRRAALSDGLRPGDIQGDVLLLDADAAKFTYEYDTKNAKAGKMDVTVSWDPWDPEIITAIDDVQTDATPVSVRYLNAAGMSANEPWQGVNIVVTTLSDGSQTVTKVMK